MTTNLVSHVSRSIVFRLVTSRLASSIISIDEEKVGPSFLFQVDLDVEGLLIRQFLALGLSPDLVQLLLQGPDLRLDPGELSTVAALGVTGAF